MSCCTTVNYFTDLHLLSVWDLIARENVPMPTKGSCLNLITFGSNIQTVTLITPSKAMFLLFLQYTFDGLHQIRPSNFRYTCQPEKRYWLFLWGARRLKMYIMSSSTGICDGDSNNSQRSAWLGWLPSWIHPGNKTDWLDAYCTCRNDCWTGTFGVRE